MSRFWFYLTLPFRPSYWLQFDTYSSVWDQELTRLLDDPDTAWGVRDAGFRIRIGGHEVWTANHPYGSFRLEPIEVRPSRYTTYRAWNEMQKRFLALNQTTRNTR